MGFSQDSDTLGLAENVRRDSEVFAESAAMMADAIGAKLDKMTFDVTFTAATGSGTSNSDTSIERVLPLAGSGDRKAILGVLSHASIRCACAIQSTCAICA